MAYDDKGTKREVESLAKRFPKRGIDPTIPEGVRRQMMDIQRQEELDKGIKAHEERRLSKGGSAKGMNMKKAKKFDDGGALTPDQTAEAIPIPEKPIPTSKMGQMGYDTPTMDAAPFPIPEKPIPTPKNEIPPLLGKQEPIFVDESYYYNKRNKPRGFTQPFSKRKLPMASGPFEYKKGGKVAAYAKGGSVGNASSRADGCAQRGHTKGKMR